VWTDILTMSSFWTTICEKLWTNSTWQCVRRDSVAKVINNLYVP